MQIRTRRARTAIAAVAGAAVLVTAAIAVALPAEAAELVTNGGFETGNLSGWSCTGGTGSVVTSPVRSGTRALSGAATASDNAQCTQTVSVQANSALTLTAWVRGNYVYLGVTGGSSTWTPSATDWTKLTVSFTSTSTQVQIYLHGWYAQGTYFADDVSLSGPAGPTPTTTRTPTAPPTTTRPPTTSPPVTTAPPTSPPPGGSPRSWPYIDVTATSPTMAQAMSATGQKHFTTAFIIGSAAGCVPTWGGTIPLTESRIVNDIRAIKNGGGDVTVAFGGAVGPYLEHVCGTQAALANAYKQVIDTLGITHIDVDIEASVNVDMMNKALRQVQQERPGTSVSYTLMVQGDDYGVTPQLGYDVLVNAKNNGVNVGIVNPMTMEFGSSRSDWGDAVIAAANATLGQMAQIWPEKTLAQRRRMLGVTPMIGRNFNGRVFQLEDGSQLVAWANANDIGLLAFWSVGRDNGGCPGGGVSPTCSSISQSTYQFTNIFKGFNG